jgi:hypothetical protein
MGVPHQLMRGRCRFCGRTLRYAKIPNRGPVMAHATGDGAACQRLQASGNDLISRQWKALANILVLLARFSLRKHRS